VELPFRSALGSLALITTLASRAIAAEDVVLADFEGTTYGSWTVTGDAFGSGPARGTLPGQMAVNGFKGQGLVNTFLKGDDSTGTLTSPEFRIERKFLSFLIGGGGNPEKLALQLLVDGKVVRSATGPNTQSGGSESLAPESWDVSEFAGRNAVIRIVDNAKGGWGHLNVDHLVQTDTRLPGLARDVKREITPHRRYLHIPIQTGAPKRVVTLFVDGTQEVRNDVELATGKPDWWAVMDVSAWKGRKLTLQVDKFPEDGSGLAAIAESDSLPDAATLYREPLRGQFHFSPQRGWNNDPNGMVFFNGEYHLFFQHNPYGWAWGNMHWGHAVSRDLIHWEELGDKLTPDPFGPMFSGSAVVDWNNTSGFGKPGKPPLVLIYTAAGNPTVQCIAHSTDGRTFTKYSGNPVIPQVTGGNRDPKVMWHEPTKKWVLVLYVELPNRGHTVHFYTSPNLKEWSLASITDGIKGSNYLFECPDFFELPVDGDPKNRRWVLLGANSEYGVGTFDGSRFTPEHSRLPGHRGQGFYAPQTFSDIPSQDGRRIQIGWYQTETKGMSFNQAMTIPLELRLTATPEGPRMTFTPVHELELLRNGMFQFDGTVVAPGQPNALAALRSELVELRAEFEPGESTEVSFSVRGATITYEPQKQEIVVNGHRAPAPLRGGRQRLTIYADRTGLEVFASDGLTYVPKPFQPKATDLGLSVESKGAPVKFTSLRAYPLKSIWNSTP
jgi:sucrose-6-phosphate hydrolase SacC (GH32 family)